jgi:hypothetical protein
MMRRKKTRLSVLFSSFSFFILESWSFVQGVWVLALIIYFALLLCIDILIVHYTIAS